MNADEACQALFGVCRGSRPVYHIGGRGEYIDFSIGGVRGDTREQYTFYLSYSKIVNGLIKKISMWITIYPNEGEWLFSEHSRGRKQLPEYETIKREFIASVLGACVKKSAYSNKE